MIIKVEMPKLGDLVLTFPWHDPEIGFISRTYKNWCGEGCYTVTYASGFTADYTEKDTLNLKRSLRNLIESWGTDETMSDNTAPRGV